MEETWNQYVEWEKKYQGSVTDIEANFKRALKQYEDRIPLEESIAGVYSRISIIQLI